VHGQVGCAHAVSQLGIPQCLDRLALQTGALCRRVIGRRKPPRSDAIALDKAVADDQAGSIEVAVIVQWAAGGMELVEQRSRCG